MAQDQDLELKLGPGPKPHSHDRKPKSPDIAHAPSLRRFANTPGLPWRTGYLGRTGARIPCKFPDTPIEFPDAPTKFPVPSRREFTRKAKLIQWFTEVVTAETGLIRQNSLYFPCLTGNFIRDEFAEDSLHRQNPSASVKRPQLRY